MIFIRLAHWALRLKRIPVGVYECYRCHLTRSPTVIWIPHNRCPSCGAFLPEELRPPTLGEAIFGIF